MNRCFSAIFFLTVVLAVVLPRQAMATLGEGADSITKDRKAMSSVKATATRRPNYSIEEITSDSTLVREYLTPSGTVFALAWNGLIHPDLTTLLGSYAGEYKDAKLRTLKRHGQHHLKVRASRVIVETWGHMRKTVGSCRARALKNRKELSEYKVACFTNQHIS